ncbi:ABC transporter substrate-binding protein [Rhodoferax sp.]|uniref:ABC transporter substrate-binding protein n=1 Tax=Rhodoferax sp. TaxID=50421 RepID=UPI002ACE937F|nr:ABC transporter substrate binding protein [Rhodoferax sp.]MDZ7920620.1 ABC transporter substrate binding protein [Rhodoferax sp.]
MGLLRALYRLLAIWVLGCAGVASAAEILVLSSERSPSYLDASQAAVRELVRLGVRRADIAVLYLPELAPPDLAAAHSAKVWITLGSDALARALSRDGRPPVVSALIPRLGFERILRESPGKTGAPVVAVYLDQPFGRQLDLMQLALPEVKRVGVLWGQESLLQQSNLQAAAQAKGIDLVAGQVPSSTSLFTGLKIVLDGADVLFAVADPQVYNSSTIANILLATYRARVPVMAFSPAYVKAGALLAVYSTPRQIGVQAGMMARTVLQGGAVPTSQYPLEFSVALNEHVARSLGMSLDESVLNERLHRLEKRP